MNYLEHLKQLSKDELINELYNRRIDALADFTQDEKMYDERDTSKRIPYIGWFWRDADFVNRQISIGRTSAGYIGIMENNKWNHPERLMTEQEASTFIEFLEAAFAERSRFDTTNKHIARSEKIFAEMRAWFQSLVI